MIEVTIFGEPLTEMAGGNFGVRSPVFSLGRLGFIPDAGGETFLHKPRPASRPDPLRQARGIARSLSPLGQRKIKCYRRYRARVVTQTMVGRKEEREERNSGVS